MEKIRLSNGKFESFITSQNETWKYYLCDSYEQAKELKITLSELGNICEIHENRYGWYLRVKK